MFRPLSRIAPGALVLTSLALSNSAHAKFIFPYNHPDLDWYTIETEHFAVHYPVSKKDKEAGNEHALTTEWSARKTAQVSEEMWPKMCGEFNYYLKERIHIVLLNQSDELQGFTIPSWDWIQVSANPGGSFYRSRGRMEWFSDVLVHEFAHVVSLKANSTLAEGSYGVLVGGLYSDGIRNTDAGVNFFLMDGDSVFWTEGGAEYWSDNTGYNWWTASRDQNIRMTVLMDKLLTYEEWHTRSGKRGPGHWNDSERYYQQGYSFGQYLRQRFGEKTYANFAIEYGKRWRPAWETVIEDVLGVDAETLYNDWVAYVTERYTAQEARVLAEGEVVGKEMLGGPQAWDFTKPSARDEWNQKKRWERESELENTGTYQWEPRISPDGRYQGVLNWGSVVVQRVDEDQTYEWTGHRASDPVRMEETGRKTTAFPSTFDHGWDFVPGKDAIVLTGSEDMMHKGEHYTGIRLETDGYDWNQLWYFDLTTRTDKVGNREVETFERKTVLGKEVFPEGSYYPIPNTQRGSDAAVSPDGSKVAYFEYTDGVLNLVTINIDGTDKKNLTNYTDGTWLQKVDWSPDGTQLVLSIFRNFQQDLYIVQADGSGIKPITWDNWEEMDAHWAADGDIYFAAEPDGIFNVYRYEPDTGDFFQVTNVVGGAVTPQISPSGHMAYTYYSAAGWKVYGLPKDEFMNRPANHLFRSGDEVDTELVNASMSYSEDLSHWAESTHKYRSRTSISAPSAVPLFRLENGSLSSWGAQAGVQVSLMDYAERHDAFFLSYLGEDVLFLGGYTYQGWYPNFSFFGYHMESKYDAGYKLDLDDDPTTTDDIEIYEVKNQQSVDVANVSVDYPWNSRFTTSLYAGYLQFGIKGVDDPAYQRYMQSLESGVTATFSNNAYFARSANPYRGRTVELNYAHAWSDVVYRPYGGYSNDDGQLMDNYQFNKGEIRWVENLPMPTLGGIPWLKKARSAHHVFQVDGRFGMVDRNVDGNNEFRAGGQHPYNYGYGTLQPNTQFAGFPNYSLSGETMAILNVAYRFPLAQHMREKVGPLFFHGLYGQVGVTAGNLWSFRPPEDESLFYRDRYGQRIAYNDEDVRREIPFVDEAYKNGNKMLYDASAELRLQSVMFHGASWDSFLRLAYGFNEIRGYGDVDGDDLFDTSDNALGDELSNETEKAGVRVYIGLGTGW